MKKIMSQLDQDSLMKIETMHHDMLRRTAAASGFKCADPLGNEVKSKDFFKVNNHKETYVQKKLGKIKDIKKEFKKGSRENWDLEY